MARPKKHKNLQETEVFEGVDKYSRFRAKHVDWPSLIIPDVETYVIYKDRYKGKPSMHIHHPTGFRCPSDRVTKNSCDGELIFSEGCPLFWEGVWAYCRTCGRDWMMASVHVKNKVMAEQKEKGIIFEDDKAVLNKEDFEPEQAVMVFENNVKKKRGRKKKVVEVLDD